MYWADQIGRNCHRFIAQCATALEPGQTFACGVEVGQLFFQLWCQIAGDVWAALAQNGQCIHRTLFQSVADMDVIGGGNILAQANIGRNHGFLW